jgi:ribonuclease HII
MTRPPCLPPSRHLCATPVAGVDEAGRGPWAGPVVAAAVIFLEQVEVPAGLADSKKISRQLRERLYPAILLHDVGVGLASVEEIDLLNIRRANHLAMQRAVANLRIMPKTIIIDGNDPAAFAYSPADIFPVIGGDALIAEISAASIVAKVARDTIMAELSLAFPRYGWAQNQGYGTAQHSEALQKYGVTPHHRRTFAPVRRLLEQDSDN